MIQKHKEKYIYLTFFLLLFSLILLMSNCGGGDDYYWKRNFFSFSLNIPKLIEEVVSLEKNGRYLGNLFVTVFSKNDFLLAMIKTIIIFSECIILSKFTQKKLIIFISTLLFIFIPNQIMIQSIVWSAGFFNYNIPVLWILIVMYVYHKIFDEDLNLNKYLIFMFFISVFNQFFSEHITLMMVCVSFIGLVYSVVKKKGRLVTTIIFTGSIIGLFLMFCNPSYNSLASGQDAYRSIDFSNFLKQFYIPGGGFDLIVKYVFDTNFYIFILISIFSIYILNRDNKNFNEYTNKIIPFIKLSLIICPIFFAFREYIFDLNNLRNQFYYIIQFLIYFIYIISLVFIAFHLFNKNKIPILSIICIISVNGPLLIVRPIGARCFYISSVLSLLFLVCLFDEIVKEKYISLCNKITKVIGLALCSILIFLQFSYITIQLEIHNRQKLIQNEMSLSKSVIEVDSLPFQSLIYYDGGLENYYYYNQPGDISFIIKEQ